MQQKKYQGCPHCNYYLHESTFHIVTGHYVCRRCGKDPVHGRQIEKKEDTTAIFTYDHPNVLL